MMVVVDGSALQWLLAGRVDGGLSGGGVGWASRVH